MNKQVKKFLEFNGKAIIFIDIQGQYWVALKPICEAFGVNFDRQYKNLKRSKLWVQLYAIQPMIGADNRSRNMVALPEMYVYGWLMSINSDVELFHHYQIECCKILYNHFRGSITQRDEILMQKSHAIRELRTLKEELNNDPKFLRMCELQGAIMRSGIEIKNIDQRQVEQQLSLFNN
jgi:hypothetical protein